VNSTFVEFSISEDTVQLILDENRQLSYMVGTASVKFRGPGGKYTELPPESQEPTILNAAGPSVSPAVTDVTETQGTQMNIEQTEKSEEEILLNMEDLILGEESQDGEYLNL
jgi:hypothetical protein